MFWRCAWLCAGVLAASAAAATGDCGAAGGVGDRRRGAGRVRIATFNAFWLFAPGGAAPWPDAAAADAHLAAVARAVRRLDADVLLLQEVEDCGRLEALRAAVDDDSYRAVLVQGTDRGTGQDVALLTRIDPAEVFRSSERAAYPVAGSECGLASGEGGTSGVSKHVVARFAVSGLPPFALVGAHLVARPTASDRCAQREAQATVLAGVVAQLRADHPGEAIVVAGDLNDFSADVPDANEREAPNSRVLDILANSVSPPLTNTASFVAQEADRWTHCGSGSCGRNPRCSQLDHILFSEELMPFAVDVGAEFVGRRKACRDELEDGGSDHFPVVLDLQTSVACDPGSPGCKCAPDGECGDAALVCIDLGCVYDDSELCKAAAVDDESDRKRSVAAAELSPALVIVGVVDGPLPGGLPKAVELLALANITDLAPFGIGVAQNGGGSDGREWRFPDNASAVAGERLWVTDAVLGDNRNGTAAFEQFFGPGFRLFSASSQAQSSGFSFNGDDAVEVFVNDTLIDVFGDASYSQLRFSYKDGFAVRRCLRSGAQFDPAHWRIEASAWGSRTERWNDTDTPYDFDAFSIDRECAAATTSSSESPTTTFVTTTGPAPTPTDACLDAVCTDGELGCFCLAGGMCNGPAECLPTDVHGQRCFFNAQFAQTASVALLAPTVAVCGLPLLLLNLK